MHCVDEKPLSVREAEMKVSVEGIEVELWTQDMSGVENKLQCVARCLRSMS